MLKQVTRGAIGEDGIGFLWKFCWHRLVPLFGTELVSPPSPTLPPVSRSRHFLFANHGVVMQDFGSKSLAQIAVYTRIGDISCKNARHRYTGDMQVLICTLHSIREIRDTCLASICDLFLQTASYTGGFPQRLHLSPSPTCPRTDVFHQ